MLAGVRVGVPEQPVADGRDEAGQSPGRSGEWATQAWGHPNSAHVTSEADGDREVIVREIT
jgi:hypothetical protein